MCIAGIPEKRQVNNNLLIQQYIHIKMSYSFIALKLTFI